MPESEDPKKVSNNDLRNSQFGGGFINADTVNAQRVGGDIWNFFFGQQMAPVGNPARPENQRLLLAQVKSEVASRLEQSLHNAVLINLGKELQPQQVKRPWDAEIKIGLKPPEPLPENTSIVEVFDSSAIAGKLLILGAPGSGKTTTMLELAQALVARAEADPTYPIPVLFNLSSWKSDRKPITKWLLNELREKYGVRVNTSANWIDYCRLLPMLDGLDELESIRQEKCVQTINQFLASEKQTLYLVLCSRQQEYESYKTKLSLNGAFCLQPLSEAQIQKYLEDVKRLGIWQSLKNDSELLEFAKSPLLLSMTIVAYHVRSPLVWQQFNSTEQRLHCLFNTYIQKMLGRNVQETWYELNEQKTLHWLSWLAKRMLRESRTEFLIERIQPNWLDKASAHLYKMLFILIYELIYGVLVGLIYGAIYGLICGIVTGSALFVVESIKPFETRRWSWTKAKHGFLKALSFGLVAGIIVGLVFWLSVGLISGIISGLPVILVVVLSSFTYLGLSGLEIQTKNFPNQGIWESAKNSVVFTLFISCPIWVLGFVLFHVMVSLLLLKITKLPIYLLLEIWTPSITSLLLFGIIPGIGFGIGYSGLSCIQHFTLRLILYWKGYIPWNYARFLDYCTERLLLQRVGGRYRFIHKLLQDHFASMPLK